MSPSWTNFEDNKFDDTDSAFPLSLSPIAEEEAVFVSDKQHSNPFTSKDAATDSSVGEQVVDKSDSEEDNPFRKDSFVGLENKQFDKVENSSQTNSSTLFSNTFDDPYSSKAVLVDKSFESCDHNNIDNKADLEQEADNPFRKDSFVLLQEEELARTEKPQHNTDHKPEPSLGTVVVEEASFHDPFLQSDPFSSAAVTTTKPLSDKDSSDFLPEEEPRSKFQLITPHSELADSVQIVPFEYDPFEEEPFISDQTTVHLHLASNSVTPVEYSSFDSYIPPPLLESSITDKDGVDSETQWHQFDSFDHSFDTFDHNSRPADSLFSTFDNHLESSESSVDHPVDLEAVNWKSFVGNSLDKMERVDTSAVPDFQDLDNTFSLDDLTNVIAEMELVKESLNEEPAPSPPAVAAKPKRAVPPSVAKKPKKASPPVPAKKYERKPTKSNEQSANKPQSFLNEVNVEKSKEKAQQIDIDIAGDVFSELEAQLQLELSANQVPDEVKEVLKELNAPYTMGLENMEAELGVKSDESKGDVGDLISELHGMGDNDDDLDEEVEQNGDEPSSELVESGLADAYTGSSMDDLLSELKGMDDGDQSSNIPPPTLPKPSKTAKQKTPVEEDLL